MPPCRVVTGPYYRAEITTAWRIPADDSPMAFVRTLVAVPPLCPARHRHALLLLPVFSQVWHHSERQRACWMALEQGTCLGSRLGGTRSIRRERGWEWDRRERQYGSGATLAVVNIHLVVAAAFAQPAAFAAFAAADVAGISL